MTALLWQSDQIALTCLLLEKECLLWFVSLCKTFGYCWPFIVDITCRLTDNEDFRGGAGHSADRQTQRGGLKENYPLSVLWAKRFICGLLPDGARRHTLQTHRGWPKVKLIVVKIPVKRLTAKKMFLC